MRRLKRKIVKSSAQVAGLTLAALIGAGTAFGAVGSNVLAADDTAVGNTQATDEGKNDNGTDSGDAGQDTADDNAGTGEDADTSSKDADTTGDADSQDMVKPYVGPVLTDMHFSDSEVWVNEGSVTLSLSLADASNVESVEVQIADEEGNFENIFIEGYAFDGNTVNIGLKLEAGTHRVSSITINEITDEYDEISTTIPEDDFTFSTPTVTVKEPELVINSVTFDMTEAEPGDVVYVTLDIENESDISIDNVDITLTNEKGESISDEGSSDGKPYFRIEKDTPTGIYHISDISISFNDYWYRKTFSEEEIKDTVKTDTLKVLEGDRTAPVINSVTASPLELSLAGVSSGTVKIKADITDDKSGVDKDDVVIKVKDPDGKEETYYMGSDLESELSFDHSSKNGTYEVTQVTARDNAGNETTKQVSVKFTVKDSMEDKEGPVVSEIRFSKNVASPDESVTVTVLADDESGVDNGTLYLKDKNGDTKYVSLKTGENKILEGSFTVHDNWANGDYEILGLEVKDNNGNTGKYGIFSEYDYDKGDYADKQYEPLSNIPKIGSFAVKDSKEDTVAPTVTSVSFKLPEGKTVADPGDEIEVSVQAEDNPGGTGLRAVRFYLRNENGGSTYTIEVDADENGSLKGTFTVGDSWDGTYNLEWLRVYDKAEGTDGVWSDSSYENHRDYEKYYYGDDGDIKSITSNPFTVKGKPATPKEDTEDPVLKSITIELPDGKTEVSPGDKIRVVAEATDNKAEDIGVEINSSIDPTDSWDIYLYKDGTTGKYVQEIIITDEWDNGEYGIDWVELNDYNGNKPWYYDKNYSSDVTADRDLANIPGTKRFKVTGSKEDHQPPVVKSVSINKYNDTDGVTVYQNLDQEPYPQFSPGDKIVFSATLADESDIQDYNKLYIYLWDTNARTATIELKRQADGTFSGETTVTDRWTNSGDSKEGKSHHNLRVYASDEFGNDTEGNLPLVGKIRIIGSKEDNDGPVLNSVTIDKTDARPGDTITITANITDANSKGTPVGVDPERVYGYLSFYYADDEKDDYHYFDMIKQSDGTYQGTVKVNDSWYNYAENGNTAYTLSLMADDIVGNYSPFGKDDVKKEVRISGAKEDRKGPEVKSVKFDKTQAKPGDVVTMSVEAEADETGIDNVYVVVYNDLGSETGDDDFTPVRGRIRVRPDSTGKLSAGIFVDNSFKNGTYKVLRINARDVLDNYKNYYQDENGRIVGSGHWDDDKDEYVYDEVVEVGEFTVKESPGVYAGSRLKSVTFSKGVYDSGATGHVTAVLEDPDADVKYADILVGVKADGRGGGLRAMSDGAIEVDGAEETFEVRLYPTEKGILEADFDVPEKESSWDREYGGSPVFNVLSALVEDNNNNIMYYTADDYVYDPEKDDYVPSENNISNILTNTFVIDEEEEEEKPADYSKVDEAISFIPAALDKYTEESIDVLNEALKKVVRGKNSTEQATVDGYAKEIQDAIDALVPKDASEPADYKRVDEAIARIPADKSMYTQESVKAVDDAVNAVIRGKKINEQPKVNDYARVINEAVRNLVKKPADYTKTDAAIAGMPADTSIYTPDSVKTAQDAIAAVIRDKKIDEQADVDAFTKAIEDAIAALVLKDADYSKVNEAKSKLPTDEYLKDCTEQSVQALKDAVAAVVEGKKADEQNTVDGYAGAIEAAITALELKLADYTQVDIAKASVPEDLTIYTDDSVKALNDAIAAVIADKKINEQDIVNEYAGAINTAVRSLVIKDADYSDVDAVKALIPPEEELEKYTDESVGVLMAAVDAVVEGKKADEQATVDDYAKAIEEAIAALVLKPEVKTDDGDTETPDNSGDTETPDNTGDTETPGDADDNEAPDEKGGTDITDDNAPEDNGTQNEDGTQDDGKVAQDGSDKSTVAGTANVGVVTPASTSRVSAVAPVSSGTVITSTNSNSAPATGKKNHLPIWLAAAGAAAAAMAGAIIKRKKKTEEK